MSRMKIFIILGVLVVLACVTFLFIKKPRPVDKSLATYSGRIEDYQGNKKLVVAFTASWASVWMLTEEQLKKLDFNRFDLRIIDDSIEPAEARRHGITLLPTVVLVESGRISKSIPNLTSIDQIRDW